MNTVMQRLRHNWKSGITVSLIAMPLSISLAVASGSTPTIGILTAVWAGLLASIFGGSDFNVVGPTGALSGLIATYVALHGAADLPSLTVVAGALILVAYLLRLERYLIFIPSSVIHGFTLGVALIIASNQFNSALGLSGLPKHERLISNLRESLRHLSDVSWTAIAVFAVFLSLLFVLKRVIPKIPGALLLSPFGIGLGYLASRSSSVGDLATLGSAYESIEFKIYVGHSYHFSQAILSSAAAIALVAILETMLSARIADGMTDTSHDERKEMIGLSLANIASGMAGGIPATAALARTSLNIKSGANHRTSAALSSIALAFVSFFLLGTFKFIPMAVIAAILVYVAIQMIELEHFERLYRHQRSGFWISIAVAAVTFYEDPTVGIFFGTAVALLLFVERLSHGHFHMTLSSFDDGHVQAITDGKLEQVRDDAVIDAVIYSFKGNLAYINGRAHLTRFEQDLHSYGVIILRLRSVFFVDLDGVEALDEIFDLLEHRGQQFCVACVNPPVASLLEEASAEYRTLLECGLVFETSQDALDYFAAKRTGAIAANSGDQQQ